MTKGYKESLGKDGRDESRSRRAGEYGPGKGQACGRERMKEIERGHGEEGGDCM